MKPLIACLFIALAVSSCSSTDPFDNRFVKQAEVTDTTRAGKILETLPPPAQPLDVVVYNFQDLTGQLKQNDNFAEYSSAVTKGGMAVLVKALLDSSQGRWFTVAERGGLNELLQERQIISVMRSTYKMPDGSQLGPLPPMIYGGMMLEGGIVFYDSNILTGGVAAGYFGITGNTQYRRDMVSVYLRAINISNGQVILSVNSSKTVFSYGVNAGFTRFLTFDKLLQTEAGFTVNEPSQFAVRQAIETAVYSLIMEGAMRDLWGFANPAQGKAAMDAYMQRKNNNKQSEITPMPGQEPERIISKNPSQPLKPTKDAVKEEQGLFDWIGNL